MRFIEANINKIKDYLRAGEHFGLPLHQDMKLSPCLPVLHNCKSGQERRRAFSLAEAHFVYHRGVQFSGGHLSVCLDRQWSCNVLCLLVSDYFLAITQHLRESQLTTGHPRPHGG